MYNSYTATDIASRYATSNGFARDLLNNILPLAVQSNENKWEIALKKTSLIACWPTFFKLKKILWEWNKNKVLKKIETENTALKKYVTDNVTQRGRNEQLHMHFTHSRKFYKKCAHHSVSDVYQKISWNRRQEIVSRSYRQRHLATSQWNTLR